MHAVTLTALATAAALTSTLTAGPAMAADGPGRQAPAAATSSAAPNTDTVGDTGTDDSNRMRLVMNAERAQRVRAAALQAIEQSVAEAQRTLPDRIRALERAVLASPVYVAPTTGVVTQWYGGHPGVDIAPPYGTPVVAAHSGVVTFVGWQDGYGMHVEVTQADGVVTTYSHMSAFRVFVGQLVVAGQQVGDVGSTGWSTGPHLHFEVHLPNGERTDPALWLRWHGISLAPEPGLGAEPIP